MAVGKGFLDQYSVFCVFGSVVGCVVVPLITQSIESVIFSAIVISLTATHLSKRAVNTDNSSKLHTQPHKDPSGKKSKEVNLNKKKSPKKSPVQVEMQVRTSDFRQRKEQKIKQIEEARKLEEQRKQEEKRERKAKKKEERLKQREEEKKLLEEGERRRKLKEEKAEKPTSPVNERRKAKNKTHVNPIQKSGCVTPSNARITSSRKPTVASVVTPLNVPAAGDALYHEKPSISPESCDSKPPSPPPSVWKVPEYVPPQWNPGKHGDRAKANQNRCSERLNNDVILEQRKTPSTPFNQLRNPVMSNQVKFKNQYMNQDKSKSNVTLKDSDPNLLADVPSKFMEKPDNRTQASTSPYSNITGLPSYFKSSTETNGIDLTQEKTYSLFGPEEPNRVLFQPIFQGNLHAP